MQKTETSTMQQIRFDGLNGAPVLAFRWPPLGGATGDPNTNLQAAIAAVAKLDTATGAVRRDLNLSPQGRVERVAPQRATAEQTTEDRLARAAAQLQRIADARAKLYAPPALDPGDAAGAALDTEIRARVGGLTEPQRRQLFDEIGAGGQEPVLLGLLRDPFATPDALAARALWGDRIKQQGKAELAALAADEEAWLWAQSALLQLQRVLASSRSFGISPLQSLAMTR